MAWAVHHAGGQPCPSYGCLHECGETVCNGSESHQMFLELVPVRKTQQANPV